MLVDTAIVGHLGTTQLASLAIAATVMSTAFTIFNFLTYGTTAVVARASGAGQDERAARLAAQALWTSLAIGVPLLGVCEAAADWTFVGSTFWASSLGFMFWVLVTAAYLSRG